MSDPPSHSSLVWSSAKALGVRKGKGSRIKPGLVGSGPRGASDPGPVMDAPLSLVIATVGWSTNFSHCRVLPSASASSVLRTRVVEGKAEGKAEGEAKGKAEGETKGEAEGEAEGGRRWPVLPGGGGGTDDAAPRYFWGSPRVWPRARRCSITW